MTSARAGVSPHRIGGIDGMRGLAVLAVLAYHAGIPGTGGGLLGVDVFFVLSGFLITSLLLAERERTGGNALGRFWQRRALRLLPALLLTLAGVAAYSRWSPAAPGQLRADFLAAAVYGSNWHYMAADQSYFAHFGAPSPLLHLWSLAVEEQFYVVWPLVAAACLARRGRRALTWVAGLGAVASALEMGWLSLAGASVSRLYYGTDTRAQALMVGCLLASALFGGDGETRGWMALVRGRAGGGLSLAAALFLLWALHGADGAGTFLYRGGFLLVALATAAMVGRVSVCPDGVLAHLLAVPPLRYLGRISYGLYLYHWPLFLILDHGHTGLAGPGLLVLRLSATLGLAVISFHLIEEPIRTGRLVKGRWVMSFGTAAMVGVTAGLLALNAGPASASARPVGAGGANLAGPKALTPRPGRPAVRAMVVGDSLGVTMAQGLEVGSASWGVTVDNEGALGCDLDPATTIRVNGEAGPAGQGCPDWAAHYAALAASHQPDVVAVLLGRFETADRLYRGHWVSVGDPAYDSHLESELVGVVDALSSRGARVVMLTLPYVGQTGEAPDGSPWPINRPSRTRTWNRLVSQAVAQRPAVARLYDLNAVFDPGGTYSSAVRGVTVRSPDQEHISRAGGEFLRPLLLPLMAQLGQTRADLRSRG